MSAASAWRTAASTGVSPRSSRYTPTPRSTLRGSGSARQAAMRPRIGSAAMGSRRSNMRFVSVALVACDCGEGALARRLEFIAGFPGGHGVGLGDEPRGEHAEARVLDHAVEIPAAFE